MANFAGTDTSAIGPVYGRRFTAGLRLCHNGGWQSKYATKTLVSSGNTCIVGLGFKSVSAFTDIPAGATESAAAVLFRVRQGGTTHVWFRVNAAGTITALCGTTVLGTTTALTVGQYPYLEFKVVIANAPDGVVTIRKNGSTLLDVTGIGTQNTASATWDEIQVGPVYTTSTVGEWCFDDLYVLDGTGSAPWNGFLGNCCVDTTWPTEEGAQSEWTPATGTDNALMVQDVAPDTDTYVTSEVPAIDTYVVEDSPQPGKLMYGVQLALSVKRADAGLFGMSAVVRQAGANRFVVLPTPGLNYAYQFVLFAANPLTGTSWTETQFNSAEFGFGRVSTVKVLLSSATVNTSTLFPLSAAHGGANQAVTIDVTLTTGVTLFPPSVALGGADGAVTTATIGSTENLFAPTVTGLSLYWELNVSQLDSTTQLQ